MLSVHSKFVTHLTGAGLIKFVRLFKYNFYYLCLSIIRIHVVKQFFLSMIKVYPHSTSEETNLSLICRHLKRWDNWPEKFISVVKQLEA